MPAARRSSAEAPWGPTAPPLRRRREGPCAVGTWPLPDSSGRGAAALRRPRVLSWPREQAEETLYAIIVDAEVAPPVARLRAHLDDTARAVGCRRLDADHEVVFEAEELRSRDTFERARLRVVVRYLPARDLTRDYFDLLEKVVRRHGRLERSQILVGRRRLLNRCVFRRVILHVVPLVGRLLLRMQELGRIVHVGRDVVDRRIAARVCNHIGDRQKDDRRKDRAKDGAGKGDSAAPR